ncbi:hypothetical protein JSR02_00810 [Candidatus Vidania fulgoroideae]|uniref:Uncharacterized protein n=1 Tax=Candidatus Vidania fulgoroideorum TaxID=881286 RepID=A0A975AE15_9PROT|nr:hypothetical protein JSR02_00810 [Candidatus Vidania fulgoroideae]
MRHKKHKKYSKKILKTLNYQIQQLLLKNTLITTHKYATILKRRIHINKISKPKITKITTHTIKHRQGDQCKMVILKIS